MLFHLASYGMSGREQVRIPLCIVVYYTATTASIRIFVSLRIIIYLGLIYLVLTLATKPDKEYVLSGIEALSDHTSEKSHKGGSYNIFAYTFSQIVI